MSKLLRFLPEQCEDVKQGRKTMTRRPVLPQPPSATTIVEWNTAACAWVPWDWQSGVGSYAGGRRTSPPFPCPYGRVGDTVPLLQPNDHEFAKGRIVSIAVERVREIGGKDALSEGMIHPAGSWPAREFQALWDSIYADKGLGWGANPWVWVVGFRVVG